jgi:hypothetical protein
VQALERYDAEYVVVGGIAAQAYGAQRPTKDFDCLINRTTENLESVAAALRDLNARLRVHGLSDEESAELPMQLDGIAIGRMEISTWRTSAGDLDLLIDIPSRDGSRVLYGDVVGRAVTLVVNDQVTVVVANLHDIIASKEWANRPKDREALPELRSLVAQMELDETSWQSREPPIRPEREGPGLGL